MKRKAALTERIESQILELINYRERIKQFRKKEEELENRIRKFVLKNGRKNDGKKYWESNKVKVILIPNTRHLVDLKKFISLVNYQQAINYLKVDYRQVLSAVKNQKIKITLKDFDEICYQIIIGKEKVCAYSKNL